MVALNACRRAGLLLVQTSLLMAPATMACAAEEIPEEWIEPSTGHRVIRLSRDPGASSFYFHQNGYTAEGDKLLVSTPSGLSTIDLKSRKIESVVEGRAGNVIVGKKTRQAFYTRGSSVYATHLDTHATREMAKLSPEI